MHTCAFFEGLGAPGTHRKCACTCTRVGFLTERGLELCACTCTRARFLGGLPRSSADQESINLDLILELILGALRGSVCSCFANKHKPVLAMNGKCVYGCGACTRDPTITQIWATTCTLVGAPPHTTQLLCGGAPQQPKEHIRT